jgi:uncharacterized protein YdeI (YjbR/CyaY-like superfamily)
MNAKVDRLVGRMKKWQAESEKLRTILLSFSLEEDLKWGQPCYTLEGKNVVLIGNKFKDYCALLFFKGALIPDPEEILVAPGQVQAGRQIRFSSLQQIVSMEPTVRAYIKQAIKIEKAGMKVEMKPHSAYEVPEELQKKLDAMPRLKKAFAALTPGRQRGYMFFISAPKLAKTREARVEKCVAPILEGKGLND